MKTAIVTGGTKGIGKAISKMLLGKGYKVYLTFAHDDCKAEYLKEELSLISNDFIITKVDQSKRADLNSFIKGILKNERHIDCIVCNAGATLRKSTWEITDDEWINVLNIILNAHFFLIRDLHDIIPGNSRIIFIGSLLGKISHATSLPYGVSKAALHALAMNLVKEFEDTGTTVNVIAPGFVETEWQKNKPLKIRENIYAKTAIKRFAEPKEIADAVRFCIENQFINGSIIDINGGYSFK